MDVFITWTGAYSVGEENFNAVFAEAVAPEHAVHGEQVVYFSLSAQLPTPSAR